MKHGSLFSGIGGFDLAAEWMGWENVFHCEWNPFGQKVLKHYWPNAISYHDITQTDFTIHRGCIDILTGGFPCQPYSMAGKRKGKDDDRHLWPEMLRAIREIQPRWVVGENVFGLVNWSGGLVFHEVQADLEAEGYEVFPYVLPACAVNAPHRRDRIWFVAHRDSNGQHRCNGKHEVNASEGREYAQRNIEQMDNVANSSCKSSRWELQQRQGQGEFGRCNSSNDATDSCNKRLQGGKESGDTEDRKWENSSEVKRTRCDKRNDRWFKNFPTQSPICGGDDGLPAQLDGISFPKWRNESIKAYGNAIVPQVAHQIFKTINEFEQCN